MKISKHLEVDYNEEKKFFVMDIRNLRDRVVLSDNEDGRYQFRISLESSKELVQYLLDTIADIEESEKLDELLEESDGKSYS
jgi:hypothetical protein